MKLKIIDTIREKIQRLMNASQQQEASNRLEAALAYAPREQQRLQEAEEQNARESAALAERLNNSRRARPK